MVATVPRQNGARQDPQCRTSLRFFRMSGLVHVSRLSRHSVSRHVDQLPRCGCWTLAKHAIVRRLPVLRLSPKLQIPDQRRLPDAPKKPTHDTNSAVPLAEAPELGDARSPAGACWGLLPDPRTPLCALLEYQNFHLQAIPCTYHKVISRISLPYWRGRTRKQLMLIEATAIKVFFGADSTAKQLQATPATSTARLQCRLLRSHMVTPAPTNSFARPLYSFHPHCTVSLAREAHPAPQTSSSLPSPARQGHSLVLTVAGR